MTHSAHPARGTDPRKPFSRSNLISLHHSEENAALAHPMEEASPARRSGQVRCKVLCLCESGLKEDAPSLVHRLPSGIARFNGFPW